MFEKNLNELIKGIRAHKGSEAKYIDTAIGECRKELKSKDQEIKAQALLKLAYLQMYGYDFSWASFQVVEVMSSSTFKEKAIGYLAASLSFKPDTDVLMLTTNLIKKDIGSSKEIEISVAIDGLSHIATPGLAMDLFTDLLPMLNHSRAVVRKKAVLVMYKIFLEYPDSLRVAFPRLREKLDDEDISVVSATVNVVCELARKNPKNYLPLAPQLFNLLTTSNNNWMVIKLIKLFISLTPLEPRLVKKLAPPLTEIVNTTSAMSLLYEAITAIISGGMLSGGPQADALAVLCVNKLHTFLEESDQNLKYVALLALAKITSTHADLVSEHHEAILACVDDADISIRLRALDLIVGMVSRETLVDVIKHLMQQFLEPPSSSPSPPLPDHYRVELVRRILAMSTRDNYANVGNSFEWYVAVLVDLARISKVDVGTDLADEILNVTARVKSVRAFGARVLRNLLSDFQVVSEAEKVPGQSPVLGAAAWIVGEYSGLLEHHKSTLDALLTPYTQKAPVHVQRVYIQAVPKAFSTWATEITSSWTLERKLEMEYVLDQILRWLDPFRYSADLEVQERAVGFHQIFLQIQQQVSETAIPDPRTYVDEATQSWDSSLPTNTFQFITDLASLFTEFELNPVSSKAQRKVPIPEGLDLQTTIFATQEYILWPDASLEETPVSVSRTRNANNESSERRRQEHLDRIRDDPFYILGDTRRSSSRADTPTSVGEDDFDSIPIVQFDGGTNLLTPVGVGANKVRKKKKKAREIILDEPPVEIAGDEMPENAALSDTEINGGRESKDGRKAGAGKNVLRNKQSRGLEDIDFEEEEKLEREAIEADRLARQSRPAVVVTPVETGEAVNEEPLVERVKKKKKKSTIGDGTKKPKKKKEKESQVV